MYIVIVSLVVKLYSHLTISVSFRIGHENFELINHDVVNPLMIEGEANLHAIVQLMFTNVLYTYITSRVSTHLRISSHPCIIRY